VIVDRIIENLVRLLPGQVIIRAQQDWIYTDVVNLFLLWAYGVPQAR
jgi:hypothetical protein